VEEDMRTRGPPGDPDRALDLEQFLETLLQGIVDDAVEEGWSEVEVDAALLGLVRARLLQRLSNAQTQRAVETAHQRMAS
jgi:hypothetical protein